MMNMIVTPVTDGSINMKRRILFLICVVLPLGVGALAGILTRGNMAVFDTIQKPVLTPPAFVFPVVWGILYLLMGISSYRAISHSQDVHQAIFITIPFVFQLALNFLWSILFFNIQTYGGAFACIVLLWIMLVRTMLCFFTVDSRSSLLLFPYLIWVSFAGYLNLSIVMLNK